MIPVAVFPHIIVKTVFYPDLQSCVTILAGSVPDTYNWYHLVPLMMRIAMTSTASFYSTRNQVIGLSSVVVRSEARVNHQGG